MRTIEKIDIPSFINLYGQELRVGDEIHYPTWTGGMQKGRITRVYTVMHRSRWNEATKAYEQEPQVRLTIERPKRRRRYDYNTKTYIEPTGMQRIRITYADRVVRILSDNEMNKWAR